MPIQFTNKSKICMEPQKTPKSHSNLDKKNKSGGVMVPNFRLYYEVINIMTNKGLA